MAQEDGGRQLLELAAERLLQADARKAASSSNYDFIKIKVRLGTHLEHYYILSRFLLSRMLTVITLPQPKAVRIALDVKKHLVDEGRLDITQEELEEALFAILRARGYGDEYVRRYQMVTRFFQQKRPLIILIAGSACTGKSSLAQQLASRLNLPNVLQTDVLYELLRASGAADLPAEPLWRRALPTNGSSSSNGGAGGDSSLIAEFQRECATIRRALDGDLCKCIRDGKSIIIEGLHIDPGLFLREFGNPLGKQPCGNPEAQQAGAAEGAAARAAGAAAGAEGAAGAGGEAGHSSAAAASEKLVGLQTADAGAAQPAAAAAAAPPLDASDTAAGSPSQQQPGGAAVEAGGAAGVRRAASFNDAVPSLAYSSGHRQESPWKGAGGAKHLRRPSSAKVAGSLQRGQAVFMLQTPDSRGGSGGGDSEGESAAPVPSPRLAACISLATVPEDRAEVERRQSGAIASRGLGNSKRGAGSNGQQAGRPGGAPPQPAPAGSGSAGDGRRQESVHSSSSNSSSSGGQLVPGGTAAAATTAAGAAAAGLGAPRPPRSSVAAADAAAAVVAGTGPVFVPICLAIREEEYGALLPGWLAHQHQQRGCGGGATAAAGRAGQADDDQAALRLRQLQKHLALYASSGVPIVEVDTSDMGQALDSMHSYVLQCIALALNP